MFRTVKRIIDWCGECKGKLYLGFLMTFLSHIFAALPLALAAWWKRRQDVRDRRRLDAQTARLIVSGAGGGR